MSEDSTDELSSPDFLTGGGEMGALMRTKDWSATALGPTTQWPSSLRSIVGLMINSLQPMFVAWGPDLTFLYNDAYQPIFGAKHPHVLGTPFRDAWADVWDDISPLIDRALAGEAVWLDDLRLVMERNGYPEETWYSFSYSPVRDESGKVAGMFCACIETTKRVLAERRSQAEQEQQRQLLRQMPGFVGVLSGPDLIYEYVNDAYVAISERDEFVGRKFSDVFPDVSEQGYRELFEGVFSSGERVVMRGMELRLHGRSEAQFIDFLVEPIRAADGAITGVFIGGYELTDLYRTTTALQHSEARLKGINANLELEVSRRSKEREQLWQLSQDMLARAAYDGGLSAVNPAWTHVLGWSEAELLANPYADIIHPDDVEVTIHALQSMGDTGTPTAFENRIRTKSGDYKSIGWTVSPEDNATNFIAIGRDLSDYKARERELVQAQEALRQSQKMEAVGQLTGGIAHDFNNLLQGIGGSLEMMERFAAQGREEKVQFYREAAVTSTHRAAALTQRLLAFARRQTLDPKPTDVNALIGGIEDLMSRSVGPQITIEIDPTPEAATTRIDPSQLENAMLNLVINARDAMPDGGRITIRTRNRTLNAAQASEQDLDAGDYVVIEVIDTGVGMSADTTSRAFDPFFTTKPIGQGTGLGLSMVYGFVRQSGGQLEVESVEGEGATMRFYLPRFVGDAAIEPSADRTQAVASDGETILVIDDEPAVRMLMVEELRGLGHRILEADDGPSGLAILDREPVIDLLITDVGLPGGMNGRQVADLARRRRPELKVLFVTGYAEQAAVGNRLHDDGMDVLVKPFAMAALGRKARDLIER